MQLSERNETTVGGHNMETWPEEGLEQVDECPACQSKARTLLYEGLADRVFFSAPGVWALFRCEHCRSAYLNPRPTRDTIDIAYQSYYTHEAHHRKPASTLSWSYYLRRILANGYLNVRYGTDYKPSSRIGYWLAHLLPSQRRVLDRTQRHLPRPAPRAKLLDVGCGNGDFMVRACDAGWSVVGVDPDPNAVREANERGLNVQRGGVSVVAGREEFDAITLSHVIEHVHKPKNVLSECFRLLKPGGTIWIETPNIESIGHQRFKDSWRGLEPPRHLLLFTFNSLQEVLQEVGFSQIESRPVPLARNCRFIYRYSCAIEQGDDPNQDNPISTIANLRVLQMAFLEWMKPKQREYVTLSARKPEDASRIETTKGRN